MTLNPSKRRTLDYILEGPWLNMGQEKEPGLKRATLGPHGPQVTEIMKNLGFEWDEIQESESTTHT